MYERIRSCVDISENYKKLSNFPFKGTNADLKIWQYLRLRKKIIC